MNIKISLGDLELSDTVSNIWIQFDTKCLKIVLSNGCSVSFNGEEIFDKAYKKLFHPDSGYVKFHTECANGHEGITRARIYPFDTKCQACDLDAVITHTTIID